jgi:hypothetical protein
VAAATTRDQVSAELDKLLPQMNDDQCKVLLLVARLSLGQSQAMPPAVVTLDGQAQGFQLDSSPPADRTQMKKTVGFRMMMVVPGVAALAAAERRAHREQPRLR